MKYVKLCGIVLFITLLLFIGCSKDEEPRSVVIDKIVSTIATDSLSLNEVYAQLRPEIDSILAMYPDSSEWKTAFVSQIEDKRSFGSLDIHVYWGSGGWSYFSMMAADFDSVKTILTVGSMIRYQYQKEGDHHLRVSDIKPIDYFDSSFSLGKVTVDTIYTND